MVGQGRGYKDILLAIVGWGIAFIAIGRIGREDGL